MCFYVIIKWHNCEVSKTDNSPRMKIILLKWASFSKPTIIKLTSQSAESNPPSSYTCQGLISVDKRSYSHYLHTCIQSK